MFLLVTVALMFFLVWMQSFTNGSSPKRIGMQALEVFEKVIDSLLDEKKMCGPQV